MPRLVLVLAIVGPRTSHTPARTKLTPAMQTTTVTTHGSVVNSAHPSRRSASMLARSRAGSGGRWSRAMQTAAAAKLAASVAMAQPPPAVATTMPAMVGPRILVALREAASSEFAAAAPSG
ncbi:MAG: hypothetical protein ACRDRD_04240 [Pseudonocardiaceae bacterium]